MNIEKDVEGSGPGLISGIISANAWRVGGNPSMRIVALQVEI
jgi:hypothetical protein